MRCPPIGLSGLCACLLVAISGCSPRPPILEYSAEVAFWNGFGRVRALEARVRPADSLYIQVLGFDSCEQFYRGEARILRTNTDIGVVGVRIADTEHRATTNALGIARLPYRFPGSPDGTEQTIHLFPFAEQEIWELWGNMYPYTKRNRDANYILLIVERISDCSVI